MSEQAVQTVQPSKNDKTVSPVLPATTAGQEVQAPLDVANGFIVTKAYRLFAEFCDACRKYQYIGICYGAPGVGKTLSAKHYARWDLLEPIMMHPATKEARPRELATCRSVLYTPPVTYTVRAMEREIAELRRRLRYVVEDVTHVHQLMGKTMGSDNSHSHQRPGDD